MSEKSKKTYNRNLFWEFFKIGIFTIGGGMAMIPQIQQVVVKDKGWLSEEEMVDCIAVSQSMPGVIAINSATYIGRKTNDRTIVSHHYSHCFIPGDGGRKSLYPGCVCWDKSSGLRIDPDFCGQAGQTDPEKTASMDPGCCSLSCHRRVWNHCCMGSPGRCCGRYFI